MINFTASQTSKPLPRNKLQGRQKLKNTTPILIIRLCYTSDHINRFKNKKATVQPASPQAIIVHCTKTIRNMDRQP